MCIQNYIHVQQSAITLSIIYINTLYIYKSTVHVISIILEFPRMAQYQRICMFMYRHGSVQGRITASVYDDRDAHYFRCTWNTPTSRLQRVYITRHTDNVDQNTRCLGHLVHIHNREDIHISNSDKLPVHRYHM